MAARPFLNRLAGTVLRPLNGIRAALPDGNIHRVRRMTCGLSSDRPLSGGSGGGGSVVPAHLRPNDDLHVYGICVAMVFLSMLNHYLCDNCASEVSTLQLKCDGMRNLCDKLEAEKAHKKSTLE